MRTTPHWISKWISNLWEKSNMPAFNKFVRSVAKQVLCRSGLYLKNETNFNSLLLDVEMMVSPKQFSVFSAASMQLSLYTNPNQLKTKILENNLRLCEENWLTNSKFSSLIEMTKVHSSSWRSMLVHLFSALRSKEWSWKTSVQTCFFWKRTTVCPCCT